MNACFEFGAFYFYVSFPSPLVLEDQELISLNQTQTGKGAVELVDEILGKLAPASK